jgi:tRNA uridine 5-carboxymethylaminomethyl modification enzyme
VLAERILGEPLRRETRASDLLARPNVGYAGVTALAGPAPDPLPSDVTEQIEIQARYRGYIERQRDEIDRQQAQDARPLPEDFDFDQVRGLSAEVREKFNRVRPSTLGQAARIPGITPAAVSLLLIHLKRQCA